MHRAHRSVGLFAGAGAALAASIMSAASIAAPAGARMLAPEDRQSSLRSTIAFVSTRHGASTAPAINLEEAYNATEIYLMDGDGANVRRLTNNTHFDGFPTLSPDGARILFDSNRQRSGGEPINVSDLFIMAADGTGQTRLVRGSSGSWSPDGRRIAFHASASGTGQPIVQLRPGAATTDSDIFVLSVDEFITKGARPRNITNNPAAVDDDADWSPHGRQIVFTSHPATDSLKTDDHPSAEIYLIDSGGTGKPSRLTNNNEEERAPSWSPDGTRIVFCCRRGGSDFEICVMNADGTRQVQLTDNTIGDLTPSWSPDGKMIVFHRIVGGPNQFQLFLINADGSGEKQLTVPPGINFLPNWGRARLR